MAAATWCPVEQTYLDVTRLIDMIVRRFYREYGKGWVTRTLGPYDEVRTTADDYFLKAYATYDPEVGAFNTWVGYKVWKGLLSLLRTTMNRRNRAKVACDVELDGLQAGERSSFDLDDFIRGLPDDAAEVVRIVCVRTPADVYLTMAQNKLRGETPTAFKEAVQEYLTDIGWASKQIKQAFKDVRLALSNN